MITAEVFTAADDAMKAFLRDVAADDTAGALRAALEAALKCCAASVKVRWLRGSDDGGGMSPTSAAQFPISPFEAWYIMQGYQVAIKQHFRWDDDDLYLFGNLEGGSNGLMLKE
jgi:hypothetical protein